MSTPDHRVEAIRNHVRPVTKKDVQSFLGTTGYYRKFIPNYAHISIELTYAMRKSAVVGIALAILSNGNYCL